MFQHKQFFTQIQIQKKPQIQIVSLLYTVTPLYFLLLFFISLPFMFLFALSSLSLILLLFLMPVLKSLQPEDPVV